MVRVKRGLWVPSRCAGSVVQSTETQQMHTCVYTTQTVHIHMFKHLRCDQAAPCHSHPGPHVILYTVHATPMCVEAGHVPALYSGHEWSASTNCTIEQQIMIARFAAGEGQVLGSALISMRTGSRCDDKGTWRNIKKVHTLLRPRTRSHRCLSHASRTVRRSPGVFHVPLWSNALPLA